MEPIRTRAGKRTYVVVLCFTIFFAAIGMINVVKIGDPTLLLIVAGVMGFIFFNISTIWFECTESHIWYKSLLKNKLVLIDDIQDVRIGPVSVKDKAPHVILNTRTQGRVVLTVRVLPLEAVQRAMEYLVERGIPFSVDGGMMARRMAAQIFPVNPRENQGNAQA